MASDNSGQINANGLTPQEASSDAGSVRQHPLAGQIQADRYAAATAAVKTTRRGLRFSKLIPSGPMPDSQGTNPNSSSGFDGGLSG